jgi:hypothetical protein
MSPMNPPALLHAALVLSAAIPLLPATGQMQNTTATEAWRAEFDRDFDFDVSAVCGVRPRSSFDRDFDAID